MSNSYIKIPLSISYKDITRGHLSFSASQYRKLELPNRNFRLVKDFLSRPLRRSDLGIEVGSLNYIGQSTHYFLRTKALQEHSFLPDITEETAPPIMPHSFVQMNLKKGDLIISKDSNIGEIVILDKDYSNMMLSGALYKLPIKNEWKYYLLAFIKHPIFREQLDFMVPKGATIRHAKTTFLGCKIPMPNHNVEDTIRYIEILVEAIINKEILIQERQKLIIELIEEELLSNQKTQKFKFELPTINEILKTGRLDTGVYTEQIKRIRFLIENYKHGYLKIDKNNIKSGSTPTLRFIGRIGSLKHRWVTPTHCSNYGILSEERIKIIGNNNINEDCILLINRTSKGGIGEYVGIAGFYKFKDFGKGHHNQGMYRVFNYPTYKLLFILSFFNCPLMRKYCADLSIGSKMKELKIEQFLQIPFPNFPDDKQRRIAILYHNPENIYQPETFSLNNFLDLDNAFNEKAGIYELDKTAKLLKEILNKAIDYIANDKEVKIKFSI